MSKNNGKFAKKKKKNGKGLLIAIIILMILLAAVIGMLFMIPEDRPEAPAPETSETEKQEQQEQHHESETKSELPAASVAEGAVNLGYGIYATDIGKYTGLYMEDGTDEVLSNILMMVVQNNGQQDIQYAEISIQLGEQTALFKVTTLPAGETMVLLEQNRMQWDEAQDYSLVYPMVDHIAYFKEPISILEEQLKIQIVDGAINVTNISDEDITGTIAVYYKNAAADLLYGGITYRISIDDGLKAGEIRQVMTNHASDTGSRIMFATISQ